MIINIFKYFSLNNLLIFTNYQCKKWENNWIENENKIVSDDLFFYKFAYIFRIDKVKFKNKKKKKTF